MITYERYGGNACKLQKTVADIVATFAYDTYSFGDSLNVSSNCYLLAGNLDKLIACHSHIFATPVKMPLQAALTTLTTDACLSCVPKPVSCHNPLPTSIRSHQGTKRSGRANLLVTAGETRSANRTSWSQENGAAAARIVEPASTSAAREVLALLAITAYICLCEHHCNIKLHMTGS